MFNVKILNFVDLTNILFVIKFENLLITIKALTNAKTNKNIKNLQNLTIELIRKYVALFKKFTIVFIKKKSIDYVKIIKIVQNLKVYIKFFIIKRTKKFC